MCVRVCCQIKSGAKTITHFIDPRTGEEVRISDSAEHMRINLLDPKWKEEREKNLVCLIVYVCARFCHFETLTVACAKRTGAAAGVEH